MIEEHNAWLAKFKEGDSVDAGNKRQNRKGFISYLFSYIQSGCVEYSIMYKGEFYAGFMNKDVKHSRLVLVERSLFKRAVMNLKEEI